MADPRRSARAFPSFWFLLFAGFLFILWAAGGASRADVPAQVIVRACAWAVIVILLVAAPREALFRPRVPWLFLAAIALIAAVQLIPLPPSVWQSLPGPKLIGIDALPLSAEPVWRPLSIIPALTWNALGALVVPAAIFGLAACLNESDRSRVPGLLLVFVTISMLLGLLQFSGGTFDNPLVNDTPGAVNGTFANRNHFALLLAIGCLLLPIWAVQGRPKIWRYVAAAGLLLLFLLTNLATGSRAGLALGVIAVVIGALLVGSHIRHISARQPRRALAAAAVGVLAIGGLVFAAVVADRTVSIERLVSIDASQDMRGRALPKSIELTLVVFPYGAGIGAFESTFRSAEPFELLKPTYFNHAHNDLVEIVFDMGLSGLILAVAAIGWWAIRSVRQISHRSSKADDIANLGSAILLLVLLASIFDYPARTPLVMAVMAIAVLWLDGSSQPRRGSALPH